jgi:hypothetical protein
MAGLEQERAKACELNNLRLYKIAQGLLWVGEGKALGLRRRMPAVRCAVRSRVMDFSSLGRALSTSLSRCQA